MTNMVPSPPNSPRPLGHVANRRFASPVLNVLAVPAHQPVSGERRASMIHPSNRLFSPEPLANGHPWLPCTCPSPHFRGRNLYWKKSLSSLHDHPMIDVPLP